MIKDPTAQVTLSSQSTVLQEIVRLWFQVFAGTSQTLLGAGIPAGPVTRTIFSNMELSKFLSSGKYSLVFIHPTKNNASKTCCIKEFPSRRNCICQKVCIFHRAILKPKPLPKEQHGTNVTKTHAHMYVAITIAKCLKGSPINQVDDCFVSVSRGITKLQAINLRYLMEL